jgi:hypothetical protein
MLVVGHINPSGIFRLDMDSRLSIDSIDGFSSIGAYFAPGEWPSGKWPFFRITCEA